MPQSTASGYDYISAGRITIRLDLDTVACQTSADVAQALRSLGDLFAETERPRIVRDCNGDCVGLVTYE